MWALDGLAWVFDWAAGRFQELADNSSWGSFWVGPWYVRPFGWAEPHLRGLAIFCWTARDRIHDFDAWIDGTLADLRRQAIELKAGIELEISYRVRQLIDGLLGGVELLRQKAEEAWNKATELWNTVNTTIKPGLELLQGAFDRLRVWVENTAIPEVKLALYYAKEDFLLNIRVITGHLDELGKTVADLSPYRDTWNLIRNSYERVRFTFTDGWDKLGAFLADPSGTIWAWLEPILLDRVEQFLNERWDTRR